MKTSKELRSDAASLRLHAGEQDADADEESASVSEEYADLIDAVAWAHKNGLHYPQACQLLDAYRASLRPAKPASGCEGCEASVNGHPNVASSYSKCLACTRYERVDRWEAKP